MRMALLKLHLSIVLAGFTGVFAKLISLNDGLLAWWRVALTVGLMGFLLRGRDDARFPPRRRTLAEFGVGSLQCLHWVLFYASIRASNISVALVCISLMGFFSALFSPLILKTPWSARQFVFSGITIAGIAMIFHFDAHYRLGITIGVVSSAVASLFVVYNKRIQVPGQSSESLFFREMLGGLLTLTLLMPGYLRLFPADSLLPSGRDLFYLIILASLCTVVLYVNQIQALRVVSAFTVNLSLNLEPVYAVILAVLFFGEAGELTMTFWMGMSLIVAAVALETLCVWRGRRESEGALVSAGDCSEPA